MIDVMLVEHFRQWGVSARSTAPIDRTRMEAAVHALYATVGLKAPRIVVVASPLAMMVAYSLATALVWMRKHHGPWTRTGPPERCDDSAIRGARREGSYFLQNRAAEYTGYVRCAGTDTAGRAATAALRRRPIGPVAGWLEPVPLAWRAYTARAGVHHQ